MYKDPLAHKWHCSVKHDTRFKSFEEFREWCVENGWEYGDYVIRRFVKWPFDKENTVISKRKSSVKRVYNGTPIIGRNFGHLKVIQKHENYTRSKPLVYAYCSLCHSKKAYTVKWLYKNADNNPNCGCVEKVKDYTQHNKRWTSEEIDSIRRAILAKPNQSVVSVCREIAPDYGVSAEKVYAVYNRMSKKGLM